MLERPGRTPLIVVPPDGSPRHRSSAPVVQQDLMPTFLDDGKEKLVWFTLSGEEQFFDLVRDPYESHNAVADPGVQDRISVWRQRLIEELAARPQDGLTDGRRLVAGRNLPSVRPELLSPR